MTIRSLSENLDESLAIAAEKLLQPKFDQEDFDRVKGQTLQGIEASKKQAAATASLVYQEVLLGKDNAIAYLDVGTAATVNALTLDDVKKFYAEHYSPAIATVIAVSDYPQADMLKKLEVFNSWSGEPVTAARLHAFPEIKKKILYLVDKPGAAQSEIRVGNRAMTFDATGEYYRAQLANYVLGGAFNSRINLNLREDKGYTYGARSGFAGEKDYGVFVASAAVRSNVTAESIVEIENELRKYAEHGITEPELTFTRNAIGQQDATNFETPGQKLGFLSQILKFDLDEKFVDEQNEILAKISQKEIGEISAKLFDVDKMIIVVVGDKATILPALEKLGYEIVELDADGNDLAGR